jgi:3-methyladenine DNA glycosylase AlkD
LLQVQKEIRKLRNRVHAEHYQRFFKTAKGEYGYGDKFLGVRVPDIRDIAKRYENLSLESVKDLLTSKYHEERFLALVILSTRYKKVKASRQVIYKFYVQHKRYINNWDLVDTSAHNIIGHYLFSEKDHSLLFKLANSKNIWDRRIAVIASFYFIKKNYFADTLKLSKKLLFDKEDLIHKATGWMLREIGKRDAAALENFLDTYGHIMPRVMLRYALEKLTKKKRLYYMEKTRV